MQEPYSLTDLESAINYWRSQSPSEGEEMRLCKPAAALAKPYALMIFNGWRTLRPDELEPEAQQAMQAWRQAKHA